MPFANGPITLSASNVGVVDAAGDRLAVNADGSINTSITLVSDAFNIVDFMDTPLLDASSSNIPASASTPLTVVASLAAQVKKVQLIDTTGSYIGLYSDPAGTPVLEAIFGPGSDSVVEVDLAATTVLGLRNMENSAVSVGLVAMNFFG